MRAMAFANRNSKELLRDPLTLLFGVGFPVVLLLLIAVLGRNVPNEAFTLELFAPGMAVFSLSFTTLFTGALVAKDRSSAFLLRLFASPLTALDYILGYAVPILPLGVAQSAVCFVVAALLGLQVSRGILLAVITLVPIAALFIGLGLFLGTVLSEKQVTSFSSILVNVAALISGTWFPLDMLGSTAKAICQALPFVHAVDATRAALAGDTAAALPHLWWVLGYTVVTFAAAVAAFRNRMRSGQT